MKLFVQVLRMQLDKAQTFKERYWENSIMPTPKDECRSSLPATENHST